MAATKKTVKTDNVKLKANVEFEKIDKEIKEKMEKNPMFKLGAIFQRLDNPIERVVLYYIAELEKKFTADEIMSIGMKAMKKAATDNKRN